jgi:hypothetical protein
VSAVGRAAGSCSLPSPPPLLLTCCIVGWEFATGFENEVQAGRLPSTMATESGCWEPLRPCGCSGTSLDMEREKREGDCRGEVAVAAAAAEEAATAGEAGEAGERAGEGCGLSLR